MNELVFKGMRKAKQVITCKQSRLSFLVKREKRKKTVLLGLILRHRNYLTV